MNRQLSNSSRNFGRLVLAAIIFGLVIYNAAALVHASRSRTDIRNYTARNRDLKHQIEMNDWLARRVEQTYKQVNYEDRKLREKLSACSSREDFAVKSGPRIAWSKLKSEDNDAVRIGLYLPAGKHHFRYAACDLAKMRVREERSNLSGTSRSTVTKGSGQDRDEFQTGPVSKIPVSVAGCELEGAPQIYEIILAAAEDKPLRLAIDGHDGSSRDCSLPMNFGPSEFRPSINKKALAFPSEVTLESTSFTSDSKLLLPPVIDLAVITIREKGTGREADIRLWIESDSPACMPAIEIAANYLSLNGWREGRFPVGTGGDFASADWEFKRLFAPYDGSERLFVRPEMISGN